MAPELLCPVKLGLPNGRVSKQADVYAFGMVVYEVLTGRAPFAGEGRWLPEIIMSVMEGDRPTMPENAEDIGFGSGTWELVQRCWNEDRNRRPTVDDISKHFRHVARTSKVVPPGPAIPVSEMGRSTVSEPNSRSGEFGKSLIRFGDVRSNLTSHNICSAIIRAFSNKHEHNQRKHNSAHQVCRRPHGRWWQAQLCSSCP